MTPEHAVMNAIRLWCGEHDLLCFRCNVGSGYTPDGNRFDTGLPKGFPDLLILTGDGRAVFCEVKGPGGKPSPEQISFIDNVRKRGFAAGVCHSVDDLIKLL